MAWLPSNQFEKDLLDLQPNFNFIHGQLAYEAVNRHQSNQKTENNHDSKTKQIADSLALMERIQQIAGTKPLGEHATMADWDDRSTVEQEVIAMMRHFNMVSTADDSLESSSDDQVLFTQKKIHVLRNGRHAFPLIVDPAYFEPGGTRKPAKTSSDCSINAEPSGSGQSNVDLANSSQSDSLGSKEASSRNSYRRSRPSQKQRKQQHFINRNNV